MGYTWSVIDYAIGITAYSAINRRGLQDVVCEGVTHNCARFEPEFILWILLVSAEDFRSFLKISSFLRYESAWLVLSVGPAWHSLCHIK
tara:strand:- start:145 stop:411 length:267 start_codon:yes stop_codon:yes gene_type:complete